MRPEDIDKLFKERLGNTSPAPPADLWNRLQERMDAEMPQEAPLQQKEQKRSIMWIYSSMAATISLLLTVGVVFYNIKTGTPEVNQTLAGKGRVELSETPVKSKPAPETIAQADVASDHHSEEKKFSAQATDPRPVASNKAKEVVKAESPATPKAVQRQPARAIAKKQPQQATGQQALAANTPTDKVEEAAESVAAPVVEPVATNAFAATNADMNAEPIEIIITRSVDAPVAMAVAEDTPSGLGKKTRLAKNIFKQVRNLATGEEVELSELGIHADKVALNTQIGKQKFSKVINL